MRLWIFLISLVLFMPLSFAEQDLKKSLDALDFEYDSIDEIDVSFEEATNFYEKMALDLRKFYYRAQDLNKKNKLKKEDLAEIAEKYRKMRKEFIHAGNLIIEGIEVPDLKQHNIVEYRIARDYVRFNLNRLNRELDNMQKENEEKEVD